MLEAHVQTRFPFLGKDRAPGDTLSAEELAQVTPQTRAALVSQGHIVLKGANGEGGAGGDPLEAIKLSKRVDELEAANADLAQRLSAAEAALNKPSDALIEAIVTTAKRAVADAVGQAQRSPAAAAEAPVGDSAKPKRQARKPRVKKEA